MKVFWDVECSRCNATFEAFVEREQSAIFEGECPTCGDGVTLERVYLHAPGISFGGISGAVRGSGFHSTDYGSHKSDLVHGRAAEHAREMGLDPDRMRRKKKATS
jgi:hypothetical protein